MRWNWKHGSTARSAKKALVADLIFDIPTLIETMSRTMTLLPGDVIATGTPVGVGIGFKPPKYLLPGDVMQVRHLGAGHAGEPDRLKRLPTIRQTNTNQYQGG